MSSPARVLGRSVPRLEDPPLLRGHGQFVGDITFPHLPQEAESVPSHDRPKPTWKCRRVGKARQGRPRGEKRLLNQVFGLLKVADER